MHLLLILFNLVFLYKIFFWLNIMEESKYDLVIFKKYLKSKNWKNSIFNFWFIIELVILFLTFIIFLDKKTEIFIYPIIIYFLFFQIFFILWKIFRKNLIKPKFNKKNILILSLIFIWIIIDLFFIINYFYTSIYSYLIILLLIPYFIIYLIIYFLQFFQKK